MISIIQRDRRLQVGAAISLAVLILVILSYVFHRTVGAVTVRWIANIVNIVFALGGAVVAGILWRSFEKGEVLRRVWGVLAIGLGLWTLGEVTWAFYDLILQVEVPFPSLADVAWVVAYVPLFIALALRYRVLRVAPTTGQIIGGTVVFTLLAILAFTFVIIPIITDPDYGALELFLSLMYPLGDLAVAVAVMLTVMVLLGGDLSWPWMLLSLGLLTIALSDLLFSYAAWAGSYVPDNPNFITAFTDITYAGGYILIAFGVHMQARLQKAA